MKLPLSRCAPSPSLAAREGDDTFAAGRPLLGVRRWVAPVAGDVGSAWRVIG